MLHVGGLIEPFLVWLYGPWLWLALIMTRSLNKEISSTSAAVKGMWACSCNRMKRQMPMENMAKQEEYEEDERESGFECTQVHLSAKEGLPITIVHV